MNLLNPPRLFYWLAVIHGFILLASFYLIRFDITGYFGLIFILITYIPARLLELIGIVFHNNSGSYLLGYSQLFAGFTLWIVIYYILCLIGKYFHKK